LKIIAGNDIWVFGHIPENKQQYLSGTAHLHAQNSPDKFVEIQKSV
jgi:hypothetical protein